MAGIHATSIQKENLRPLISRNDEMKLASQATSVELDGSNSAKTFWTFSSVATERTGQPQETNIPESLLPSDVAFRRESFYVRPHDVSIRNQEHKKLKHKSLVVSSKRQGLKHTVQTYHNFSSHFDTSVREWNPEMQVLQLCLEILA